MLKSRSQFQIHVNVHFLLLFFAPNCDEDSYATAHLMFCCLGLSFGGCIVLERN